MESGLKLVMFDCWCPTCKFKNTLETEEPCNECLTYPANEDSTKPIKWEENK